MNDLSSDLQVIPSTRPSLYGQILTAWLTRRWNWLLIVVVATLGVIWHLSIDRLQGTEPSDAFFDRIWIRFVVCGFAFLALYANLSHFYGPYPSRLVPSYGVKHERFTLAAVAIFCLALLVLFPVAAEISIWFSIASIVMTAVGSLVLFRLAISESSQRIFLAAVWLLYILIFLAADTSNDYMIAGVSSTAFVAALIRNASPFFWIAINIVSFTSLFLLLRPLRNLACETEQAEESVGRSDKHTQIWYRRISQANPKYIWGRIKLLWLADRAIAFASPIGFFVYLSGTGLVIMLWFYLRDSIPSFEHGFRYLAFVVIVIISLQGMPSNGRGSIELEMLFPRRRSGMYLDRLLAHLAFLSFGSFALLQAVGAVNVFCGNPLAVAACVTCLFVALAFSLLMASIKVWLTTIDNVFAAVPFVVLGVAAVGVFHSHLFAVSDTPTWRNDFSALPTAPWVMPFMMTLAVFLAWTGHHRWMGTEFGVLANR